VTCDDPAVDERGARIAYYALAVALAIVLALPGEPGIIAWAVIILGGVAATILRSRWLRMRGWSRTDLGWGALFAVVFLPLALLLRSFPFDR
jgi:hypothetical protein